MSDKKSWTCTVSELSQFVSGQVSGEPQVSFHRVGTDTRQDLKGRLYIPLKGDRFNGHDFVPQAVEKGCSAVMVHEWREEWKPLTLRASFVRVSDTLQALQTFARQWRKQHRFFVFGITGSNGKTSTKEFTYALLKDHLAICANRGSFNNHWGVPLTLLEAGPEHTHVLSEMGMNKPGEIWRLCQIAEPDVVVVTTVGRAHIGEMGSQAATAQAKEEIYVSSPNALQVFNIDNEWTMRMQSRSKARQLTFSAFRSTANVHFRAQRLSWDGIDVVGHIQGVKGHTWINVLGRHNVNNLMAASCLALAAGLKPEQIWEKLSKVSNAAWGRNQVVLLKNGARVLFDAYNSNPDSMEAMLKNLYEMETVGRKFLIIGDMKELGNFSDLGHEECGERAGNCHFHGIWYVGQNVGAFARGLEKVAQPYIFVHSPDVDQEIASQFLSHLKDGDLVAVKGSRGMELERVLQHWPLVTPLGKKP